MNELVWPKNLPCCSIMTPFHDGAPNTTVQVIALNVLPQGPPNNAVELDIDSLTLGRNSYIVEENNEHALGQTSLLWTWRLQALPISRL